MNEGDTKNGITNPWAIISNEPYDSQLAEPIQNFNHENGVWEYYFIIIMSCTRLKNLVETAVYNDFVGNRKIISKVLNRSE